MNDETREAGFVLRSRAQGSSIAFFQGLGKAVGIARAVGLSTLISAGAFAGPDWDKDLQQDAGAGIPNAQIITIQGPVLRITGILNGLAFQGPSDFQDVYLFSITEPTKFTIDTTSGVGEADFDTCLWLFSIDGKPLLGNNDAAPGVLGSLLTNQSNDGPSVTITVPGLYYLAITGFASQPLDGDKPLFPDSVFTAGNITGGLGGRFTSSWSGEGASGNYALDVTGVSGVPAPSAAALIAMAGILGRGRGRGRFNRGHSRS